MSLTPTHMQPVPFEPLDLGYANFGTFQPFSERTGIGYQELVESMKAYLRKLHLFLVQSNPQGVWNENADKLFAAFDATNVALQASLNSALDTQAGNVQAALTAQQEAIDTQLTDTLAGLAGGSISITDPVVKNAINTSGTQTRTLLDTLYAAKGVVDSLVALTTGEGRLSAASLAAAFEVSDADLAAFVTNPTSQTRAAFNSLYERLEFQVYGGYLQTRYVGDPTWQNLIAISDLTGPRGLPGEGGNPGGAAELAYAEMTSVQVVATGSSVVDIPGLSISVVMPNRPVMLLFGAILQGVQTANPDSVVQIIETTGGGSTVVAEFHAGYSVNTSDFHEVHNQRRITGTAGTTRTFKAIAVQRAANTWKVVAAQAYPAWIAAHQC